MRKKITDTTATYALGDPAQARLFQVSSGVYTGRRVALIQTAANDIRLAWSDAPGTSWSSLVTVATDASDGKFDAVMTSGGDIQVAYSEQTTNYLVTRRLTLGAGTWSIGSKVTIYNGTQCYEPSLARDVDDTLWIAYASFATPNRTIYAKSSTDYGVSWGSGAADAGDALAGPTIFVWAKTIIDSSQVHVILSLQDTAISIRSRALSGGSWSATNDIATGSGFNTNFDAAIAADGRLGVTFSRDQLYFREYDGAAWGALGVLADHSVMSPQLLYENNIPAIVYLDLIGGGMKVARYLDRRTGSFGTVAAVDDRSAPLEAILLYNAAADSYENRTSQGDSQTTADVYHTGSGTLLKESGDAVYLGQNARFRATRFVLSTLGVGGTLLVSYWDGAAWQSFTPANGAPDLGDGTSDLQFWIDYNAVPVDWQKRLVNSDSKYWIKIEVASAYTTGPVASQVSAAGETDRITFRR